MTAYRKRPVVVDAVQWLAHGDDPDVRPLTPEDPCGNGPCEVDGLRPEVHGWISTLEAGHRVCPGDWLITGVKGERYPCKSDVFERTYEPAPEVTAPGAGTPAATAPGLQIYRVRFEVVGQTALRKYSNADPLLYKNTTQTVPNSQIPDEDWHEVTGHETDNPWQQYNQLRKWVAEDQGFVRNVRLEKLVSEPRWEAVDDRG